MKTLIFRAVAAFVFVILGLSAAQAQILTKEDSLNANLKVTGNQTVISGYGELQYSNNLTEGVASANLTRAVTFIGHRFSRNIFFFSEVELENAKVGGGLGGEISLEQALVKFNLNRDVYLLAGLFLPRIGLMNENHLPTTFSTTLRPVVETMLIPSTWRELGVGFYAASRSIPGLNYSAGIMNGLDASGFNTATGIGGGRFEGRNASARNLAITGALLYYVGAFRFQVSGYYGGSVGLSNRKADSLGLQTGTFGTPVSLVEANVQYHKRGLYVRALGTAIHIAQASRINAAYATNSPSQMNGAYAEVGYNILPLFSAAAREQAQANGQSDRILNAFARYETVQMNARLPENGLADPQYDQQHLFAGLNYLPVPGVIIKAEYHYASSGAPNNALNPNPLPSSTFPPFYTQKHYVNLGLGYSF